ncbi:hypothetical protein HDU79_008586 [Rhizoclosmatium sp. JEL0117]|nr:hypothetical protein HDU79_008586 [Rhizoclosmatium sp. JEL0117]
MNSVSPAPEPTEVKSSVTGDVTGGVSSTESETRSGNVPLEHGVDESHQTTSHATHHLGTQADLTEQHAPPLPVSTDDDTTPTHAAPDIPDATVDTNASVFSLNGANANAPFHPDTDAPALPGGRSSADGALSPLHRVITAQTDANTSPSSPHTDNSALLLTTGQSGDLPPPPTPSVPAPAAAASATPAAKEEEVPEVMRELHFQLIPFVQQGQPPNPTVECMERKIQEGEIVRIGRKVVKNGVEQLLDGQKDSPLNVWYQSKVVSRNHAEIWIQDGQLYVKDAGSSSGTFLNKMRLSPSGKESRPYTLRENDLLVFGVDYKGKSDEDLYKCVSVRIGFYDNTWIKQLRKKANPAKFKKALKQLLSASNPHSAHQNDDDDDTPPEDCCICIGEILPLQAIFIAPCSHCFHYKCVNSILVQSQMFQCPMCRQVANLAASVSTESLDGPVKSAPLSPVKPTTPHGMEGEEHNRGETAVPPDDAASVASPSSAAAHAAPVPSIPHHMHSGNNADSAHSSSPSLNSQSSKFGWSKKKVFGGLFGGKKKDDASSP